MCRENSPNTEKYEPGSMPDMRIQVNLSGPCHEAYFLVMKT